jgi:glycosyltransferase involved in cell wall biosynthesis
MKYIGSVYGEQKNEVFNKSDFYILPSFSEGLPSAMLEAMGFGLIPIITEGCNFPDAFIHNLGVRITTEKDSIRKTLEETSAWDRTIMHEKSNKNRDFIRLHYSINAITKMQMELFNKILPPYSIAGDNN